MGKLNKIIVPLPAGFKTPYEFPETANLFDGDNLVLHVPRGNYNAPQVIDKDIRLGINTAAEVVTNNFYVPTIDVPDQRSVIALLLRDLQKIGNIETQGITVNYSSKKERFMVILDYHRYDTVADYAQGYTLRVGVMNVEDRKGSFRSRTNLNYNRGTRINYTHTHDIVSGALVDFRAKL